ncbi:MAG: folate-binding protein YgfZ [Chromatiales bacterium]|nr:folate-binding protein YgfZ [Chromatiales bacterium]
MTMNSEWNAFLQTQPEPVDIASTLPQCAIFDLSHLSLTRVSGEDAEDFLQGQFTNDIKQVSASHSQMSGFCTPKGRMLANFRIAMHNDDYLLQMPAATQAPLLKRLPMFVLMSKVTITDASDELAQMGIAGDCAEEVLGELFAEVPGTDGASCTEQDVTLIRIPGTQPRFMLIGAPGRLITIWTNLAGKAAAATPRHWELLDIRAGIPTVHAETAEAFIPQMTNMQLIDGVSFTKGCYTGQEVVARMKYLGKLKRKMYLAQVASDELPKPGAELVSPSSASGQGAGKVVNAQFSPEGGVELLAVVEVSSQEADDLHLGDGSGPKLQFRELPYSLAE